MANFGDLRARVLSGIVMAVVGVAAIWLGGYTFGVLAVVLAGLMGWELHKMMVPDAPEGRAEATGVVAAILVGVFTVWQGGWFALAGLALGAVAMAWKMPRDRVIFGLYFALILWAAHGLIVLREGYGLIFVLWLVCVVIASDVAGYFAGRVIGGPKFWPRVSPKKTWSGTVAGWLLAAGVGAGFVVWGGMPGEVIALSSLLAFAGQLGDIAESAIKRRMKVKDSSNLIPGHGGVLDRFDAMIAVAALALVLAYLGAFSGHIVPGLPG
ncbi:phosphatidate cytidylyltransferase [Pararhodobacter zhoushanensis]|uniref:phosphatidate cytidylyltransferase n=1 Tax=Pararhodobacter zhoushanensis TaxID=2479545 RepID=UPI000F8F4647|nr:phosphatidate cytidylyltransferase [Pararhodobacter zhoushanensis]